jgi:hypothetical protein
MGCDGTLSTSGIGVVCKWWIGGKGADEGHEDETKLGERGAAEPTDEVGGLARRCRR